MHRRVWPLVAVVGLISCTKPATDSTPKPDPAKAAPDSTPASKPSAPTKPKAAASKTIPGDPPRLEPKRPGVEKAIALLSDLVRAGATDVTNPWAMAHGLIAFGPDLKTADGNLVAEVLLKDHLVRRKSAGRTVDVFPPRTASGEPVEPHPFLVAKTLAESGVSRNKRFKAKDGPTTLRKLADDAAWLFDVPSTDAGWHNASWALSLFATRPPADGALKTQTGTLKWKSVASASLARLEREQAFLAPLMAQGRPDLVKKNRQGIYGHTCGGLHFVQAVTRSAGRFSEFQPRVREQLALVRFRWAAERRLYRRMADRQPRYRPLLLVQELKFYGHVLETMALAVKWGVLRANDELKQEMRYVAGDLLRTIADLEPLYKGQARLRAGAPQTYYDLIGDGCHAIRGLRESLVAFF